MDSLSVEEIYGLIKTVVDANTNDNEMNDETIEFCADLGLLLPVSSPSTEKCLDDSRFLLLWSTDHGKEHLVKVLLELKHVNIPRSHVEGGSPCRN
jgi:hypothetical protein